MITVITVIKVFIDRKASQKKKERKKETDKKA